MRRQGKKKFVFNVDYFLSRIRDLTNFLALGEVKVHHTKFGNGNVKAAARVNVRNTLNRHESINFGHIWIGIYLH